MASFTLAHLAQGTIFPDIGFATTLLSLAVVQMALIPTTMATPTALVMPLTLVITSNIEPGISYDGGMGPFIIGKDLTITCSTEKSKALSWWEGDKQLPTVVEVVNGISSCSHIVGTLQAKDAHRHFTCRELGSGTEKSVDLHLGNDDMELRNGGYPLRNEQLVEVIAGTNFSIDCIVKGSNPSTGTWWEGNTKLQAKRTQRPNAIFNQLTIRPVRIEDNGRTLTCRARNGQLTKTVTLNVVEDIRPVVSPATHALSTNRTRATTSSADGQITVPSPAAHAPSGKRNQATASSANTAQPIDTTSKGKSVATTTTEKPQYLNEMNKILVALVAAVIAVCVVLIILAALILTKVITINTRNISTSQQDGNSAEHWSNFPRTEMSERNSLESVNPHNLPPLSSLLASLPTVGRNDETASSGGRMSVVRPDDRDHSYYYPGLINNSYNYPKITDEIEQSSLLANSGQ